jgi:amino acid transporter
VFGRPGAFFYAWIVCLSTLGALNSIIFSAGRLAQAAGQRHYLPAFLKLGSGMSTSSTSTRTTSVGIFTRARSLLSPEKDQNTPMQVPLNPSKPLIIFDYSLKFSRNAMLLNAGLAAMYIVLGSFRGLLSFKGNNIGRLLYNLRLADFCLSGMVEYIVYLTTISGLLLLRYREHYSDNVSPGVRIYLTPIFNPVIFCSIAALIVLRSTIAHLPQALMIVLLFGTSAVVYQSRWWKMISGVEVPSPAG